MLTIIGCGNLNRSDDGVGSIIASRLMALPNLPSGARIFDAGTGGMEVMFQARGASRLIIIDASQSGSKPGSIFEVPGSELEGEPPAGFNLHEFRWDHALYAGRRMFRDEFPEDVTVFLIEAANLNLGTALSPAVAAAADKLFTTLRSRLGLSRGGVD
ncbi:MAG: hydrogenase maturation protease [Gammaproteobacteria bacterium]|nr:hydrogenase maturation protease [Gammaproteobacteria bacterium]MCY4297220.1 hydrogenase maturation protease [Gammaproteobacteria bacterium]